MIDESTDYSSSFNFNVYDLVPKFSKCLDVGCSSGNLGKRLIEKKECKVHGIEHNRIAAGSALANGYEEVFDIDLNTYKSELKDINEKYDTIICADILEHLINPDSVLRDISKLLGKNGRIIISLPNVAFIQVRLELLFGRWKYKKYGIMDSTHLRFFSIKSGCSMVKKANLNIDKVIPYNQFGILKLLRVLIYLMPSLFAYQFIIISKK